MPVHGSNKEPQHKCIGFSQALEEQRTKREERSGPQSWVSRKFAVGLAVAIVSYTYYVYVARFCITMIRRESSALGGRTVGSKWHVVFTPPGYAADYVSKTLPPAPRPASLPHTRPWDTEDSIGRGPYNAPASPSRTYSRPSVDIPSISNETSSPQSPRPPRSPPHSRHNTHESTLSMSQNRPAPPRRKGSTDAGARDTVQPMTSSFGVTNSSHRLKPPPPVHDPHTSKGSHSGLPPLPFSRRPPTHPVLSPEYRYCSRDGFVKPMRTHHCRSCGTCILKYDHHCPWIGQCVGAFNHKFFVNFLQWCSIFTTFIFASLLALVVRASTAATPPSVDPQHIVILALSGLFTLFTVALLLSQIHFILLNMTTVEHLGMQRMRDRERSVLDRMTRFPCSCSSEPNFSPADGPLASRSPVRVLISRRRILKQWDAEWGRIDKEGNLWWLGSRRANWETTMGTSKLGWILPIGRSLGDGLTYPTNPRFDHEGRWRRRPEWPDGLR
ncbi:DHHC palmitoyltransferase-domain-containing protein [Gautieria morchelliformis]|nr:DHHC palmitoyltransferase-domain-containing protein [Gautieria morchelliformis]